MRRRKRHEKLILERVERLAEDVYWDRYRSSTAALAQLVYEHRTGLPAFTARPIVVFGDDELPMMRVV